MTLVTVARRVAAARNAGCWDRVEDGSTAETEDGAR
jgi:hypothetical protein